MDDNNFEIELQEGSTEQNARVQLPVNFLTIGEIENDDVKVYIKQDVYKALEKYALEDVEHERGTIILGDYCEDLGKTHVVISAYIEAKYTDASASTLTFTHETWDYVNKQHDTIYPNTKIVGWQHTHPNYGIFLSNYDLFIQENFFNMSFQVAYVIDPIQNIRGFFQWKNGKIEKLKGFYIYDDVGKPIKIEQKRTETKADISSPKVNKSVYFILALLCVATMVLAISTISINSKYKSQLLKQEEMMSEIAEQNELLDNQDKAITELQEQLINGVLDESGATTAADLIEMIENQEITLQNQEEVLNALKAFVEEKRTEDSATISFKAYTVVKGDSLEKICSDNGIDYYSNIKIILAINGIENANQINIGQTILLPISN